MFRVPTWKGCVCIGGQEGRGKTQRARIINAQCNPDAQTTSPADLFLSRRFSEIQSADENYQFNRHASCRVTICPRHSATSTAKLPESELKPSVGGLPGMLNLLSSLTAAQCHQQGAGQNHSCAVRNPPGPKAQPRDVQGDWGSGRSHAKQEAGP